MTGDRALFLDRDGVINVDRHYVHRIEDFEFVPGIFDLCAHAQAAGYRLVVVTNQAGIARGYYTQADFELLTRWMVETFAQRGIAIDRVYHCPFHPTAGLGDYRRESFDRKPNPGMLLRARDELGLDLARSAFVGDKDSDMEAGRRAGVGRLIKLADAEEAAEPRAGDVTIVTSLAAAAALLREVPAGDPRR
ncbi:MAG: HAD family hydrolase [Rubrivivax sp.]|nr:HAD family hydrolase [Rubrivivax sp.]